MNPVVRSLLLSLIACAATTACSQQPEPPPAPTIPHSVLSEEASDRPGKTQITLNLLVAPDMAEADLRALLNSKYVEASRRTGFQYHEHATVIAIYAYPSREHAQSGMGQWSAMLMKTPTDPQPKISIGLAVGKPPAAAERFGLSEDARRDVFQRLVAAQDRALAEAEKRYPQPIGQDVMKQADLESELNERYRAALLEETGLADDQLSAIADEALEHNWPMPKRQR